MSRQVHPAGGDTLPSGVLGNGGVGQRGERIWNTGRDREMARGWSAAVPAKVNQRGAERIVVWAVKAVCEVCEGVAVWETEQEADGCME